MTRASEIIVGVDIGTTKVTSVIGEVSEEGIEVIGIGDHNCKGLQKGVVVNRSVDIAELEDELIRLIR